MFPTNFEGQTFGLAPCYILEVLRRHLKLVSLSLLRVSLLNRSRLSTNRPLRPETLRNGSSYYRRLSSLQNTKVSRTTLRLMRRKMEALYVTPSIGSLFKIKTSIFQSSSLSSTLQEGRSDSTADDLDPECDLEEPLYMSPETHSGVWEVSLKVGTFHSSSKLKTSNDLGSPQGGTTSCRSQSPYLTHTGSKMVLKDQRRHFRRWTDVKTITLRSLGNSDSRWLFRKWYVSFVPSKTPMFLYTL